MQDPRSTPSPQLRGLEEISIYSLALALRLRGNLDLLPRPALRGEGWGEGLLK